MQLDEGSPNHQGAAGAAYVEDHGGRRHAGVCCRAGRAEVLVEDSHSTGVRHHREHLWTVVEVG